MVIFDLYSKRQKRLRGDVSDVIIHDQIPRILRVQIMNIVRDTIGNLDNFPEKTWLDNLHNSNKYSSLEVKKSFVIRSYKYIVEVLCNEYGVLKLSELGEHMHDDAKGYFEQLSDCFLDTNNIELVLDIIDLCFRFIDNNVRKNPTQYPLVDSTIKLSLNNAILELNKRFREHGIGYRFENGEILRIDSTLIHNEITKPTLTLLSNPKFRGAQEEYLKAHEHYRHKRNKECLNECLKAFESTLNIICTENHWFFSPTDTSRQLIEICFDNGLIPKFLRCQFSSLQCVLESGVPTIRNKTSGHGQGQTPKPLDDDITRYALNLTGANIIFLVEKSGIK